VSERARSPESTSAYEALRYVARGLRGGHQVFSRREPVGNFDLDGHRVDGGRPCVAYDYMRSGRCGAPRGIRAITWRTPSGWNVYGMHDGNCSFSRDRPAGFNFKPACAMHDYGYELIRRRYIRGDSVGRKTVDDIWIETLYHGTCGQYGIVRRKVCNPVALSQLPQHLLGRQGGLQLSLPGRHTPGVTVTAECAPSAASASVSDIGDQGRVAGGSARSAGP